MASGLVERRQQFFALKKFLVDAETEGSWKLPDFSPPTFLLAQIRGLDREIVSQLEHVGIFDTDDLQSAGERILEHNIMSRSDFDHLTQQVEQFLREQQDIPRVILELPENYLLLSMVSTPQTNALALLWRGVLFSWGCPSSEGWHLIKFPFDRYFDKMNRPEIIGSYAHISSPPTWLAGLSDISTFLSGIFPGTDLADQVWQWGFPKVVPPDPIDRAEYQVLQLAYTIDIALQFHRQLTQLS